MNSSSQVLAFGIITIAALALTGCQSSGNSTADATASPDINIGGTNTTMAMIGKRTFTIADAVGGGHSSITGVQGGATQMVDKVLQRGMGQLGYVYQASGPADFIVTPRWEYSSEESPPVAPTLPMEGSASTRQIHLVLVFTDTASGNVLWSKENPYAVDTSLLSADKARDMTNFILSALPAANPPATVSSTSP